MRITLVLSLALLAALATAGCEEKKPEGDAPSRFASVKRDGAAKAASTFCEKQWPVGEGSKRSISHLRLRSSAMRPHLHPRPALLPLSTALEQV